MDKIAGLLAIFIHEWRRVIQQACAEDGTDTGVRIRQRLPRPVTIEVAERNGRHSECASHDEREPLLVKLGDGIHRSREELLALSRRLRRENAAALRAVLVPFAFS